MSAVVSPYVFPIALLPALTDSLRPPVASHIAIEEESETSHRLLEELFLSEVIYPQDAGELQVTSGLRIGRDGSHTDVTVPLFVEYGITDRFQLELFVPYERDGEADASGIGNIGVGVLYQLEPAPSVGLQFAVGAEVSFPSLSSDVGESGSSFEPFALAYHSGERFDVNAGLGVSLEHDHGDDGIGGEAAIALLSDLGRCTGTFELHGELEEGDLALSAAPGVVWRVGDFEIGCAVAAGLTEDAPDVQLLITLTREWQLRRIDTVHTRAAR